MIIDVEFSECCWGLEFPEVGEFVFSVTVCCRRKQALFACAKIAGFRVTKIEKYLFLFYD